MAATTPIALLGGTFDPVHYGHLRFADEVRRALGLDEIRLVPAGDPPHRDGPEASAADRVAMLRLAVEEFPGLVVDTSETERQGKSYTVLTLESLRRAHPHAPLLLLLGADAFRGLPAWHRWQDIFALAHIVVVERPGAGIEPLPSALAAQWATRHVDNPERLLQQPAGKILRVPIAPHPIAATMIRAQLGRGDASAIALRGLLPPAVLAYIGQHQLYSPRPDAP
jgi:nicotinate-nucleotide adenylyltransferase